MSNVVTIHQPNYLPWIGLFNKVALADKFIIADTFPYTNHSITNRNKIRTSNGWSYLTIPVSRDFHMSRICDVKLPQNSSWRQTHWRSIYINYVKANFFNNYCIFFEELYQESFDYLSELNIEIIKYLIRSFKLDTEIIKSSDLNVDQDLHQTEAIIALLKAVKADTYLAGPSGKAYLDLEQFRENGINLSYHNFHSPVYKQRFEGFIAEMSAIDLLFNLGPKSSKIVRESGDIEICKCD